MGATIEFLNYRADLGSPLNEGARKVFSLNGNQTPSFIPNPYLQTWTEEKEWNGARSVDKLFVCPEIDESNVEREAAQLSEEISCHFEMRIQLFYQQLCLCYNSQMTILEQSAEAQAGLKGSSSNGQLAEAHSSTLPSLRAWDMFQDNKGFGPEAEEIIAISLGKESSFFHSWNTTVRLPEFVNKADSKLDFQTKFPFLGNQTFREYCVQLLTRVASGKLNPQEGLQNFLARLQQCFEFLQQEAPVDKKSPAKKRLFTEKKSPVFQIYSSVAKFYSGFIKKTENLEKLTFTKEPHLHYKKIQKKMWNQMGREVEAYEKVQEIHQLAVKTLKLQGGEHNLNYLVPGILLNAFGLYPMAQKMIEEANENRSSTQIEYAVQLSEDPEIIALAKDYFSDFGSSEEVIADIKSRDIKRNLFYQDFAKRAIKKLGCVQKLPIIFLTALPRLYAHFHATPQSLAVRRFLCLNDSWFSYLTKDMKQLREWIALCSADREILKLTKKLVQILEGN